jgi:hypothetical protein
VDACAVAACAFITGRLQVLGAIRLSVPESARLHVRVRRGRQQQHGAHRRTERACAVHQRRHGVGVHQPVRCVRDVGRGCKRTRCVPERIRECDGRVCGVLSVRVRAVWMLHNVSQLFHYCWWLLERVSVLAQLALCLTVFARSVICLRTRRAAGVRLRRRASRARVRLAVQAPLHLRWRARL